MSVLQMSLSGAVLIAVIIVIRALFLHKLPKKTFTLLWTLALIRLLIPFSVPSTLSVYSWIPNVSGSTGEYVRNIGALEESTTVGILKTEAETFYERHEAESMRETADFDRSENVWNMPFPLNEAVRFAGFSVCALIFIFLYLRSIREFKASLPLDNAFIKEWIEKHRLKRRISVRYSDRISAPLSYGFLKPVILFPKTLNLDDTESLSYILTHEYIHIKRFDILTKAFLIAALCIHWFNPAVWVMFFMFNRDIELSCDEAVVRIFGEKSKAPYAYALIDMEAKKDKFMPLCSNFSKNAVKERIISVMKIKKISVFMILFAVIFVTGTAAIFMTSAKEKDVKDVSEVNYKSIEALKFKDYEKMSVSDYIDKVLKIMDTPEYAENFEKISDDENFYKKRDTDEEAVFFYYILSPLLTRDRRNPKISGYIEVGKGIPTLEYSFGLNIVNPEKLTVGDYKKAVEEIKSEVDSLKDDLTKKDFKNDNELDEVFKTGINKIAKKISADNLKITVEGVSKTENNEDKDEEAEVAEMEKDEKTEEKPVETGEARREEHATKEDYESLFNYLKKPGYKNMSVKEFNKELLNWMGNGNDLSMDRINEDIVYEDFAVALSEEEKEFLTTVFLSGLENAEKLKALYTGEKEKLPVISVSFSEDTKITDEKYESRNLSYSFSYDISGNNKITTAERDNAVKSFIRAGGKILGSPELDDLPKIEKEDIIKKLKEIAEKYSENGVKFKILDNQVVFDNINETRK